jgi:uncharacterized membrane protein YgaE (UPF0421/DUF939 family)
MEDLMARRASGKAPLFPHVAPEDPIKPWVDPVSGERFRTVSLELPDGAFLAFVAESPDVRVTAESRQAAEARLLALYGRILRGKAEVVSAQDNPEEDAALAELAKRNARTHKMISARDALKALGHGLDRKSIRK